MELLEKDCFASLSNLEELTIGAGNEVGKFDCHIFNSLINLRKLEFQTDFKVPSTLLFGLSMLEILNLSENNLNLDSILFESLVSLKTLNISKCNIEKIENSDVFAKLSKLESLDLSENLISFISSDLFKPLIQLKELRLNKNKLSKIDQPRLFLTLKDLELLNLSDNPISFIHSDTFINLNNLDRLFLYNTKLTIFDFISNKKLRK